MNQVNDDDDDDDDDAAGVAGALGVGVDGAEEATTDN